MKDMFKNGVSRMSLGEQGSFKGAICQPGSLSVWIEMSNAVAINVSGITEYTNAKFIQMQNIVNANFAERKWRSNTLSCSITLFPFTTIS
jgi:hypothetical protein